MSALPLCPSAPICPSAPPPLSAPLCSSLPLAAVEVAHYEARLRTWQHQAEAMAPLIEARKAIGAQLGDDVLPLRTL